MLIQCCVTNLLLCCGNKLTYLLTYLPELCDGNESFPCVLTVWCVLFTFVPVRVHGREGGGSSTLHCPCMPTYYVHVDLYMGGSILYIDI